jgi:hypothetical protein
MITNLVDHALRQRPATFLHSQRVGELIVQVVKEALDRSTCHDRSKTEPPEADAEFTPKLKTSTYGSDEYKGYLEAMGEGLKHHYEANRHHPEHFENGVNDMTLVDLVEMLADWKAATERHDDGNLAKSLEIQRERFGLSDQLVAILRNTAEHFGWSSRPKPPGLPIAHCQHLSDEGRADPSRAGRHGAHRWFDVASG